ncbi:helix-turn-helix domain-containing protein [Kaistella palustris]|uniref:helix-turn-helix domain-containing protein n=1 Tax=Kaistella palustris TaxID=493376 RepID=UPI0004226BAA|nr:helix-turn-helix domain-containing protein [Kaistella palustris]
MNTRLSIPKHCQLCGQAFVAQTTTTRYCGDRCAKLAYKLRKKEEKIQQALSEQTNFANDAKPQNLQSLQTLQPFLNLKNKEFLSVQEAAELLGASRWTIQRLVQRNVLHAAKLGRRTIIQRSEIDNLFKTDGK